MIQKSAYYLAKSHWRPIEREEAQEEAEEKQTSGGSKFHRGGRVMKKSSWEREKS